MDAGECPDAGGIIASQRVRIGEILVAEHFVDAVEAPFNSRRGSSIRPVENHCDLGTKIRTIVVNRVERSVPAAIEIARYLTVFGEEECVVIRATGQVLETAEVKDASATDISGIGVGDVPGACDVRTDQVIVSVSRRLKALEPSERGQPGGGACL